MTDRLVVRIAVRDLTAGEVREVGTADGGRSAGRTVRPWIVGGIAAVGLSIVVAAASLLGVFGNESVEGGVPAPEAAAMDPGPDQSPVDRPIETAAVPLEPAAGPPPARTDATADPTVRPPSAGAKPPEQPPVANGRPVARPASGVPQDGDTPDRNGTAAHAAAGEAADTLTAAGGPEKAKAPQTAASAIADPRVVRALLSDGIRGREPTVGLRPPIQVTGRDSRTLYYFSEVRDFEGETLFHRWEREGTVLMSIPFEVRGQRWRIHSNKRIMPGMTGRWRVVLADAGGNELASSEFSVR